MPSGFDHARWTSICGDGTVEVEWRALVNEDASFADDARSSLFEPIT